jgi:peptidoglycan/LPS O-acetylase OafA/YrhL
MNPGHGGICPILPVGWTLCYEMFFYLLFALSLGLCKRPMIFLIPLLLALVGLSVFRTADWLSATILINPILLEFVFGMVIALAVRAGRLLPAAPALVVFVVMLLVLITSPYLPFYDYFASLSGNSDTSNFRPLVYGVPCALLLYAALSLESPARGWLVGLPLLIGDASYSIYLSHSFVTAPLGFAWEKSHWTGPPAAYSLVAACLVVSILVGIAVHWFIENPLLHYLNKRVHQPDPVGIGTASN